LHGHNFKILAQGFAKQDQNGIIIPGTAGVTIQTKMFSNQTFNIGATLDSDIDLNKNGILKDSLFVPDFGWALVEIEFTNPGLFLFHCHHMSHFTEGMTSIIKIGNRMVRPLKMDNWPTCDDFVGNEIEEDKFMNNVRNFPFKRLKNRKIVAEYLEAKSRYEEMVEKMMGEEM